MKIKWFAYLQSCIGLGKILVLVMKIFLSFFGNTLSDDIKAKVENISDYQIGPALEYDWGLNEQAKLSKLKTLFAEIFGETCLWVV